VQGQEGVDMVYWFFIHFSLNSILNCFGCLFSFAAHILPIPLLLYGSAFNSRLQRLQCIFMPLYLCFCISIGSYRFRPHIYVHGTTQCWSYHILRNMYKSCILRHIQTGLYFGYCSNQLMQAALLYVYHFLLCQRI